MTKVNWEENMQRLSVSKLVALNGKAEAEKSGSVTGSLLL